MAGKLPPGDLQRACEEVRITRRLVTTGLLSLAGVTASRAAGDPRALGAPPSTQLMTPPITKSGAAPAPPEMFRVLRAEDMLVLGVVLDNLVVKGPLGARNLVRIDPGQPGRLIVVHQAQAIADQAFQECSDQPIHVQPNGEDTNQSNPGPEAAPVPPNVAAARIAGWSRVVFVMPESQASHPWGLEGILEACGAWPMALDNTARPAPSDFWRLSNPGEALGAMRTRLDHIGAVLRASLPAEQQDRSSRAIDAAALRLGQAIDTAIQSGRPLSEDEIDRRIDWEVGAFLGPAPAADDPGPHLYARRALEAAAVSCAITLAEDTSATNAPVGAKPPKGRSKTPLLVPLPLLRPQGAPATTRPGEAPPSVRPPPAVHQPFRPLGPFRPAPQPTPPGAAQPPPTAQPPAVAEPVAPIERVPEAPRSVLEPHRPTGPVTALEIPYRLFQSPLATAGWAHAKAAITHRGRTELWHTRLGARGASGVDDRAPQPLRAIWSWDYPQSAPPDPPEPPSWALKGEDRRMLVKLTAGFGEKELSSSPLGVYAPKPYTPRPSLARRLMLTALGGWLDLDGHWDVRPENVDIQAWSHKTAMARDYFVRVVYAGFLFPFGHAASLVKVSERKFETRGDGGRIAVLRQRYFIIVRERTRLYPGANQAFDGRDLPFKQVDILTKVTPDLVMPADRHGFFPVTASGDLLFQMVGTDGAGRQIAFSAPLFFLSELHNNATDIGAVESKTGIAWTYSNSTRSKAALNGATIRYAPQDLGGGAKGDTDLPTEVLTFRGAAPTAAVDAHQPQFYPAAAEARVVLPAVKQMLGLTAAPLVSFSKAYLDGGFSAGAGQVFLDIRTPVSLPVDASHPTDRFGGMISPNLAPTALSRKFGVVAGKPDPALGNAAKFLKGQFDPSDFLPADAKLLGAIPLTDVLNVIDFAAEPGKADQAPHFTHVETTDSIEVDFTLTQGSLRSTSLFIPSGATQLSILSKTVIPRKAGAPATSSINASLNAFKVNLFGFIVLSFDMLRYELEPGLKPIVSVDLSPKDGVMFGGPLEFVNTLKDVIPSNGFSDPPGVSVTPDGISASYSLGLPTIAVGVMSLQNVSLGAGFNLPFTGDAPSARFNFAERHNPFNLTVSLFGGGGFVAITVDTGGVRELESALEFGAQVSIDLGVASGAVYIKGGFYFHWKDAPDSLVYFEGYVELGGQLSVLDLITASLVFHLALAYEKTNGGSRVFGQATLTVEVDVLFFSTSVGVTVEKDFAGASDPRFIDFIPTDQTWRLYCGAFA